MKRRSAIGAALSVLAGVFGFRAAGVTSVVPVVGTPGTRARTEDEDWKDRILRYRGGGSGSDGIHVLREVEVDDLDYKLMAADNSCARIKSGGGDGGTEGRWFQLKRGSDLSRRGFFNSHGTSYDGGKTYVTEQALLMVPRREFEVSVEEVMWHRRRVDALIAEGIGQPDRVRIMTKERQARPWE